MTRHRLTACLIVQDEQEHLPRALESVAFCDEIVVVDGGSTDRTIEIARAAGAHTIENPWPGFAVQRNVALDAASGEWVFELDADERISPALRASIERFLLDPPEHVDIAVCPLRNRFLGGWIGPSAKYPAYRSRLFRRGAYRHDESRAVHEGVEPRERPALLDGDLEHELASTPREALRDAWRYALLESSNVAAPHGALPYLVGIVLRPTAKAAYRLVVDRGWRDGWRGLLKIGLDTASDALVWLLVLSSSVRARASSRQGPAQAGDALTEGSPTESSGPATTLGGAHFGRRPAGPPKVIALAPRGAGAAAAREWLEALCRAGIDTALVSDCRDEDGLDRGSEDGSIPIVQLPALRLLATMRALDVEMQVRTAHAVVPFGARAKLLHRLLPGSLRPSIPGVDAATNPSLAVERLRTCLT